MGLCHQHLSLADDHHARAAAKGGVEKGDGETGGPMTIPRLGLTVKGLA
jgi:hypothetical protein